MSDKILDALIAARVPSDVILAVAKLIADAKLTQERRDRNRTRMQSVRTHVRNGAHTETHGNTPARSLTSLTESWTPTEETKRKILLMVSAEAFAIGFDRFKQYHIAGDIRAADWNAKLRYWFTFPQKGQVNGNGHTPRPHSQADANERWRAAIDRLQDDPRAGDEPGADDDRRLPRLPSI